MIRMFIFLVCLTGASLVRAEPPPVYLSSALQIWAHVVPPEDKNIFKTIHFIPVSGARVPLARYTPKEDGVIEIGQNFREYKNDYIYLSSNMDISTKPDFRQYMVVMTLLSLANESAHIKQDKERSLDKFIKLYKSGRIKEACALYSLQQHLSDIVMLRVAVDTEYFFLGAGNVKGLNALRLALEKNDLRDEFEDFREAIKNHNENQWNTITRAIRAKRETANMAGIPACRQGSY